MTVDRPTILRGEADHCGLVDALRMRLGPERVSTAESERDTASHDSWPVSTKLALLGRHEYRPDVVVSVIDVDQIAVVLALAADHDVPVTVRALGSSVTGQPLPVAGGITLDVTGLPATHRVDTTNLLVEASASVNGGELEEVLNVDGWTLGHSPQSLYRSTVGGWVATMATGQFSSYYGGIEDLVSAYTAILATGETIRVGEIPRAAIGPDLRQLLLGSEGALGVILSVALKIFPLPESRRLRAYRLPDLEAGIRILRGQAMHGLRPFLLRLYDADEARRVVRSTADTGPVLFVGTQGITAIAEAELEALDALARQHGGESLGEEPVERWMANRFDFSSVEERLARPGGFAETIEVAHTWTGILPLYHELKQALGGLAEEVLVHFSHVYTQGTSMYLIPVGNLDTDEEAVQRLSTIWQTAMEICLTHGAVLSHHHGGGLARSSYVRRSLGPAHLLLRRIKAALDPDGLLNPGKLGL